VASCGARIVFQPIHLPSLREFARDVSRLAAVRYRQDPLDLVIDLARLFAHVSAGNLHAPLPAGTFSGLAFAFALPLLLALPRCWHIDLRGDPQ
jgi:hypothetical protein